MATVSLLDSKHVQEYEFALDRLEAGESPRRQRPIVERRSPALSQQEAVNAAAKALGALWGKRPARSGGGNR